MNMTKRIFTGLDSRHKESGIALLDVVLAVAVFALGMLALAQLQGNLTRASADANQRTVAANIAEEMIETLRGYREVLANPDNGVWDYQEMDGTALNDTVTRGGIDYTRTVTVANFWWDEDAERYIRNHSAEPPTGLGHLVYPDFKLLRLDVVWADNPEFRIDDDTTADLGTGSVTVYEIITSTPSIYGAHVVSSLDDDEGTPVTYNPGDNPDIVALQLNSEGTRFKESTSAQPKTFHEGKVETWFDVVTYSQVTEEDEVTGEILETNTFLRREQFVAVSCTCEYVASPESTFGYLPTLWNGVSYTMGELSNGSGENPDLPLVKPIGVADSTVQQSAFCTECCRDHHDYPGDSNEQSYRPWVEDSHKHYNRDGDGNLSSVAVEDGGNGDLTYVEACRLVRKDGFMRVTQDARQQTLIGFPEAYLEFDAGIDNYSGYVLSSVNAYYPDQTGFSQPTPGEFPARRSSDATSLGRPGPFYTQQQMRSRSVYTDYLTAAASAVIANCFPTANDDCAAPNATTALEIYPFFDLQMTWLSDWMDETANGLVEVKSDGIKEGDKDGDLMPDYDRGLVLNQAEDTESGAVQVSINSFKGNAGLTATQPISSSAQSSDDSLFLEVNESAATVPPIGTVVSGAILEGSKFVKVSDLTFSSDLAVCGKTTTLWSCVVPAAGATLTITYDKQKTANICSTLPDRMVSSDLLTTTFSLPEAGGSHDIIVSDDDC